MQYISTRGSAMPLSSAEAIKQGLAPDGGLYLPDGFPAFSLDDLHDMAPLSYDQRAALVLSRFLTDYSLEELSASTAKAYADFAPKMVQLTDSAHILELYHGPTCAFKDFALQMLPHLLTAAIRKTGEDRTIVILTATSGDTGKAALAGFADVPGTKICVFYPNGGTSRIQQLQMTTQEGENVQVLAVDGNFDDAQTGVKKLFLDTKLGEELANAGYLFSSANSINWGRLAPQIAYYVSAYVDLAAAGTIHLGDPVNVCVPTGNFGNILAAYIAKECGLPIAKLICASNANRVLTDFITTGVYDANRPFYLTASPSMDILISSNLERLLYLLSDRNAETVQGMMQSLSATGRYTIPDAMKSRLNDLFYAGSADDAAAFTTIREAWQAHGYLMDPHTAVGYNVYEQYVAETNDHTPTIIASTASPYKFPASVLSALGEEVPTDEFAELNTLENLTHTKAPASLAGLQGKDERFTDVVEPDAMKQAVKDWLA